MSNYRILPYAALMLRLALGSAWLSHALLKLAAYSMPALAGFLNLEGMPTPMAWPVALVELVGGAMIVLGVYGPVASLALLPLLAGSLLAHVGNGLFPTVPGGGWLYPAVLMMGALLHARIGDGLGALHAPVAKRRLRCATAVA